MFGLLQQRPLLPASTSGTRVVDAVQASSDQMWWGAVAAVSDEFINRRGSKMSAFATELEAGLERFE